MISLFHVEKLIDIICVGLPALGITSLSILLFNEPLSFETRKYPLECSVFVAYDIDRSGSTQIAGVQGVEPGTLFPAEFTFTNRNTHHIVMPLHFEKRYLGMAAFAYAKEGDNFLYEDIRCHLSSVLAACRICTTE